MRQFPSDNDANSSGKHNLLKRSWPPSQILFAKRKLLKLRKRFACSSAQKIMSLLKKADPSNADSSAKELLDETSGS